MMPGNPYILVFQNPYGIGVDEFIPLIGVDEFIPLTQGGCPSGGFLPSSSLTLESEWYLGGLIMFFLEVLNN